MWMRGLSYLSTICPPRSATWINRTGDGNNARQAKPQSTLDFPRWSLDALIVPWFWLWWMMMTSVLLERKRLEESPTTRREREGLPLLTLTLTLISVISLVADWYSLWSHRRRMCSVVRRIPKYSRQPTTTKKKEENVNFVLKSV